MSEIRGIRGSERFVYVVVLSAKSRRVICTNGVMHLTRTSKCECKEYGRVLIRHQVDPLIIVQYIKYVVSKIGFFLGVRYPTVKEFLVHMRE